MNAQMLKDMIREFRNTTAVGRDRMWPALMAAIDQCAATADAPVAEPVAWNHTTAELAAIYGEMAAINETPAKEQSDAQRERLKNLRAEAVAIGVRRYALARSHAPEDAKDAERYRFMRGMLQEVELHEYAVMPPERWDEAIDQDMNRATKANGERNDIQA